MFQYSSLSSLWKTNHISNECRKKKVQKQTFHYGWMSCWPYHLEAMIFHKSYHHIQSLVKTYLNGKDTKNNVFECLTDDDFGHDPPILEVLLSWISSKWLYSNMVLSTTLRGYTNEMKMVSVKSKPPNQVKIVSGQPKPPYTMINWFKAIHEKTCDFPIFNS